MMMKTFYMTGILALVGVMSSCTGTVSMVPDNGRQVVRPKGSSDVEKSWNQTTRAEGDAALGPLSNMRR